MTVLTSAEMESIVSLSFSDTAKVFDHHLEPVSEYKSGIFGTHLRLFVKIKHPLKEVKSMTFFVKTKPDRKIQNFIMDESIFEEEIHFYKEIHPQLVENSKGDKWSPQCYFSKPEVLVLEDLGKQGYQSRKGPTIDKRYIKSALRTLARFHASSLIEEARLGKSLQEAYPSSFKEKIFSNLTKIGQTTKLSFETVRVMAERLGMDTSLLPEIVNRVYQMVSINTTGLNVICHNDLYANNLMFNDADPCNCMLIDYQLLRYHSPVLDILMLLYLNTMPEFRKKSELFLIEHYYKTLKSVLDGSKYKLESPNFEKITNDYQKYRLVGIAYGLMYLPALLMKDKFTEIVNDSEKLKKWCLESRMNEINSNLDGNPTYKSIIKEILAEFLEEGRRVLIGNRKNVIMN